MTSGVADFSRPSIDVDRKTDSEWQWGVTHTVRPERHEPIVAGVEYHITVKAQRKVGAAGSETRLADLYARARAIADVRCRAFARDADGVREWIVCQGWRTMPTGHGAFAFAFITTGLLLPAADQIAPVGETAPTPAELMTSGGTPIEVLRRQNPQRATEVFVEFDHRDVDTAGTPLFTYSYGERVGNPAVQDFEPFVRRAEHAARTHQALFDWPIASQTPSPIMRREWFLADTLVTVELHIDP